uniref:Uncharacterized protein n=1 Tax=Lygus hesperus TaxID=30085 RepID=A0A146LTS5_LYGHE
MFFNQTLQERYRRILEHLVKIDGVISETLGLVGDAQDLKQSSEEDSLVSPVVCAQLDTTGEIQDQTDCEMTEMNGEILVTGEMIEGDSEMTDGNSEINEGSSEMNAENSDETETNSEIIEAVSEMCEHDSGNGAVSEEDLAYEGPEIVIDAQVEAGTEEKNDTEENPT